MLFRSEMSLIMLLNKVQKAADLEQLLQISGDKFDRIVKDSPEHVMDVIVSSMESLCFKIDVSAEERLECVRKVRERKMGYLWENMEKFSIQEERRKTEEQRKKTEEERKKTEEERKKTEEQRKRAEEEHRQAEQQRKLAEKECREKMEQQARAETAERKLSETEEKLRAAEALIKQLNDEVLKQKPADYF